MPEGGWGGGRVSGVGGFQMTGPLVRDARKKQQQANKQTK